MVEAKWLKLVMITTQCSVWYALLLGYSLLLYLQKFIVYPLGLNKKQTELKS